jgi:hypothetical protein
VKALHAELVAADPVRRGGPEAFGPSAPKDGGDLGEVAKDFAPKSFDEPAHRLQRKQLLERESHGNNHATH